MSISFRPTAIIDKGDFVSVFGQLLFTGSYVSGGDQLVNAAGAQAPEAFPPATPGNTAGMGVFLLGQTSLHVSRPPLVWNIQPDQGASSSAGVTLVLVPGVKAFDFKIKAYNSSSGAEFSSGAYSGLAARLDNAVYNTIELSYKKNI